MPKKFVVAVLPDGTEHFEEIQPFNTRDFTSADYKHVCENALHKAGVVTLRSDPKPVQVDLFSIHLIDGSMRRRMLGSYSVMPPLEGMTETQYNTAMSEILSEVPEEFRSYVSSASWNRGHSAGFDECVAIAREMVDDLKPCIQQFQVRLTTWTV